MQKPSRTWKTKIAEERLAVRSAIWLHSAAVNSQDKAPVRTGDKIEIATTSGHKHLATVTWDQTKNSCDDSIGVMVDATSPETVTWWRLTLATEADGDDLVPSEDSGVQVWVVRQQDVRAT